MIALTVTASGSSVHITAAGHIGPLVMDQSNRAAVVHFYGEPQAERHGLNPDSRVPHDVLGYECGTSGFPVTAKGPTCRTVFWIVSRTGKLGDFYTEDPRFQINGVRVGTASATAEHVLHHRLYAGCIDALHVGSVGIAFEGGRMHVSPAGNHVTGARVYAIAVDGRAGIFDCL